MSYLLEGPRRGQNLNGLLLAQGSKVEQFAEREQWERLAASLALLRDLPLLCHLPPTV